jgi:hypothetical protein
VFFTKAWGFHFEFASNELLQSLIASQIETILKNKNHCQVINANPKTTQEVKNN